MKKRFIQFRLALTITTFIAALSCGMAGLRSNAESTIFITSVTPMLPLANQTIIIRGGGFGLPPKVRNLGDSLDTVPDIFSPSIAIIDRGPGRDNWEAGRYSNGVYDWIGLKIVSWSDSGIVLNGFGSKLGSMWGISPGDPIEIVIFEPNNSASISFETVVTNPASGILKSDAHPTSLHEYASRVPQVMNEIFGTVCCCFMPIVLLILLSKYVRGDGGGGGDRTSTTGNGSGREGFHVKIKETREAAAAAGEAIGEERERARNEDRQRREEN